MHPYWTRSSMHRQVSSTDRVCTIDRKANRSQRPILLLLAHRKHLWPLLWYFPSWCIIFSWHVEWWITLLYSAEGRQGRQRVDPPNKWKNTTKLKPTRNIFGTAMGQLKPQNLFNYWKRLWGHRPNRTEVHYSRLLNVMGKHTTIVSQNVLKIRTWNFLFAL